MDTDSQIKELVKGQTVTVTVGDTLRLRLFTERPAPLASQTGITFLTPQPVYPYPPPQKGVDQANPTSAEANYARAMQDYQNAEGLWLESHQPQFVGVECSVRQGESPNEVVIEGKLERLSALKNGPGAITHAGTYHLSPVNPFQAQPGQLLTVNSPKDEFSSRSICIAEDIPATPLPTPEVVTLVDAPLFGDSGPADPSKPPAVHSVPVPSPREPLPPSTIPTKPAGNTGSLPAAFTPGSKWRVSNLASNGTQQYDLTILAVEGEWLSCTTDVSAHKQETVWLNVMSLTGVLWLQVE